MPFQALIKMKLTFARTDPLNVSDAGGTAPAGDLFQTPATSRQTLKRTKGPPARVGTREHQAFLNESTNGAERREGGDIGQASE